MQQICHNNWSRRRNRPRYRINTIKLQPIRGKSLNRLAQLESWCWNKRFLPPAPPLQFCHPLASCLPAFVSAIIHLQVRFRLVELYHPPQPHRRSVCVFVSSLNHVIKLNWYHDYVFNLIFPIYCLFLLFWRNLWVWSEQNNSCWYVFALKSLMLVFITNLLLVCN